MDKSLFNEYAAWNEDALALGAKAEIALRPVIKEFLDMGYPIREISHIIMLEMVGRECEVVLGRAMEKRRREREGKKK